MKRSQHLSDEALHILAILFEAMELSACLPRQIEKVLIALLPKSSGGFRPIGLFPAVYRLWGRSRRRLAKEWELAHYRSYFVAGQHAGATDVVWRQSVRAEAGTLQGECAASVLWDMSKFYESFNLGDLRILALRLGFPPAIVGPALHA